MVTTGTVPIDSAANVRGVIAELLNGAIGIFQNIDENKHRLDTYSLVYVKKGKIYVQEVDNVYKPNYNIYDTPNSPKIMSQKEFYDMIWDEKAPGKELRDNKGVVTERDGTPKMIPGEGKIYSIYMIHSGGTDGLYESLRCLINKELI